MEVYIYKTTNKINNKSYIGKCVKLPKDTKFYYGSGTAIKNAINKYGKENFIKEIIDYCDDHKTLCEKEIYWIAFYNSTNQKIGYNIMYGGEGGKLNQLSKDKISKTLTGRKLSKETRAKMSASRTGIKFDSSFGQKISKAKLGKKFSEEHKENLSKNCWNKKLIFLFNSNKELINEFESVRALCRFLNIKSTCVVDRRIRNKKMY